MSSIVPEMASVVRDFESRSRSHTAATAPPTSPPVSRGLERQGTNTSRLSTPTKDNLRFRRPSRSNTVTTYHEPEPHETAWQPGAEPGIDPSAEEDHIPPGVSSLKANCDINIIDYSDTDVRNLTATNESLANALEEPPPEDLPCRWISVNGLSWDVIRILGKHYHLHRLAIEDMVHTHSRTKVDWYTDHACIILTLQKLVRLHWDLSTGSSCDCGNHEDLETNEKHHHHKRGLFHRKHKRETSNDLPQYINKEFVAAHAGTSHDGPIKPIRTLHRYESSQIPEHTDFMEKHSTLAAEDLAVSVEQVTIFLMADNTVISFFEQSADDVEKPILRRLDSTETILRRSQDASLLVQAIIDAIVDLAIPVKDAYNKARKELQVDAMINPNIATSRALHIFGEEIDMLQNLFKPIVHLINALRDHNSAPPPPAPPPFVSTPSQEDHPTPLKSEIKTDKKLDRSGAPTFNRKLSDFRRTMPLKGIETTSVTITPLAHTYFGDVLDHCITMIQTLEQMDASAANISTLIFNTVGARTNNFMMILAVVTVLFSPLTFITGYFGQNFASGKGLKHPFAYFWYVSIPVLVAFTLLVFATMLWDNIKDFFQKRGIRTHRNRRNKMRRARMLSAVN